MSKPVMIVALDNSEHSYYALRWTLQHFFGSPRTDWAFSLLILHAKPSAVNSAGLAGPSAATVLPCVDSELKRIATRVIQKATDICAASLMKDVNVEVVEGDPKSVLCQAVEEHHASVLVVGSHGYGAIKRAVLGSVSDYCAHNAHCSVMIVKKPKH